jgi:hypothetical protein
MAAYPGVSLVFLGTASIQNHLSATCGYRYRDRVGAVELHGKFDASGDFWPLVTYEVATGKDKWHTISGTAPSRDSVAIKIDSTNSRALLHIDMDPFRDLIGKYRWGRIALENGEAAILPLDDLLPTGDNPDETDFKAAVNDGDPHRFGSSFSLLAVTCFSERLIGDFAFVCPETKCVTEVWGQRDSKGDFSPFVTLQAGNSDKEWQDVQKPGKTAGGTVLKVSNENLIQTVSVDLTPYKSLIGKVKYGKVVFSNEDFSVFALDSLKPPFMKQPSVPEP